jgi:hypothetical protein
LIERLRVARPEARFLELVHRLDRDTSGVLLVAKKRAALLALHATLREGQADKRYLVLAKGRWRDAKRRVELPLARFVTRSGEREVRVEHGDGRMARTVFYRRRVWPKATPPVSLLDSLREQPWTRWVVVGLGVVIVVGLGWLGWSAWKGRYESQGNMAFAQARTLVAQAGAPGAPVE